MDRQRLGEVFQRLLFPPHQTVDVAQRAQHDAPKPAIGHLVEDGEGPLVLLERVAEVLTKRVQTGPPAARHALQPSISHRTVQRDGGVVASGGFLPLIQGGVEIAQAAQGNRLRASAPHLAVNRDRFFETRSRIGSPSLPPMQGCDVRQRFALVLHVAELTTQGEGPLEVSQRVVDGAQSRPGDAQQQMAHCLCEPILRELGLLQRLLEDV